MRVLSVYGLVPLSNFHGRRISAAWQHVLVAGGMRGALALALALSLGRTFPYRQQILAMTFGVVAFTIIVQELAIKPLLHILGIGTVGEDAYEIARVQQIAASSARSELDTMFSTITSYRDQPTSIFVKVSRASCKVQSSASPKLMEAMRREFLPR